MVDSNLTERDMERTTTSELKKLLGCIPPNKLTLTEKQLLCAVLLPIRDRLAAEDAPVLKLRVV
jgi:hypothetical protein